MATRMSLGGNWSAAGSWAVCDATAELDSEANLFSLGTGNSDSATFTPGAITVDGIALKFALNSTPTGTITVTLRNSTDSTNVVSVTTNVSDLTVPGATGVYSWNFFKFSSSQLLVAGKAYLIRATKSSASGTLNLAASTAAAANMSRQLRTTTTGVPVAGDKVIICGELTGAGTGNDVTITLDGDQSAVSLGATTFTESVHLSRRGTLTFSTSSAANPKLKWKGIFGVYDGTLNIGTSGTPIPSNSTAELYMDSAANVDSALVINSGATVNIYGATKTTVATLMTADKAAAATVIALGSTTDWAVGDVLAFASTSRTAADVETKTILTVDSSTQVTLSAGLTNAHSGTSPTQGEVINLTRNIKIHGASTSLQGYIVTGATPVINIQYAELYNLGSGTFLKRGIDVVTTTGTFNMKYCALHDFVVASSLGINITGTSGQTASTLILQSNVLYNIASVAIGIAVTSGTWLMDGNYVFAAGSTGFSLADVGGTFTNNTAVSGTTVGISLSEVAAAVTCSGNVAHSNASNGLVLTGIQNCTISNFAIWRNATGPGMVSQTSNFRNMVFSGFTVFGNATSNLGLSVNFSGLFTNCTFAGDSSFATSSGVTFSNVVSNIFFENCSFGVASGIFVAHAVQDFSFSGGAGSVFLRNCVLASTTEVANFSASNQSRDSYILSQKHDQTAGNHKFWVAFGIGSIDTAVFHTASPALRLTPNTAGSKLESAPGGYGATAAVASGGAITVSVWVRKSVSTDTGGANYNGNQQRLIVRKNIAAGISADTVLATAAAAVGTWEQLSGTTASVTDDGVLEFIVDCDGTAGWVNVDDWTFTPVADTKSGKYWLDGVPMVNGDNSANVIVVDD